MSGHPGPSHDREVYPLLPRHHAEVRVMVATLGRDRACARLGCSVTTLLKLLDSGASEKSRDAVVRRLENDHG
jgi:hypothetical protein